MDSDPPPNPYISPPQVVSVTGWLLVAAFVVATFVRLGTKVSMKRMLGIDDILIVLAMLFGIGQMIATHIQVRHENISSGDNWSIFQKAFYASQLLFIPTLCVAKLSVLHSFHKITPAREHKALIVAFAVLVCVMLPIIEFLAAFQCGGHRWDILASRCIDQLSFWKAFGAIDIITDLFIGLFPVFIVAGLQMRTKFKFIVAGVFATRLVVVVAAAVRLYFLTRSHANVLVSSYDFWIFILSSEIQQGLSIITACIPFLKPFFESLETGMLAPSHGLTTLMSVTIESGNRRKESHNKESSLKLNSRDHTEHVINVSRRISTHSSECGLIKEESQSWIHPVPPARSSV